MRILGYMFMKKLNYVAQNTLLRLLIFGLFAVALTVNACNGGTATTSINTTTATGIPEPPSAEELAVQGFFVPELPRVTCEQLKQMIDSGEPLVVVDTRAGPTYNTGHIPQSINIPYQRIDEIETSLLALPKDRPIIFY